MSAFDACTRMYFNARMAPDRTLHRTRVALAGRVSASNRLQDHAALSRALLPAFQRADGCKIGLELTSDLRKLARSYSHMDAFTHAECCLDLKQLWQLYTSEPNEAGKLQPGSPRRGKSVGLSFLAQKLLGKPLDKAMQVRHSGTLLLPCACAVSRCPAFVRSSQCRAGEVVRLRSHDNTHESLRQGGYVFGLHVQVSDWSQRPLTERQLRYAALDAAVQLPLADAMMKGQSFDASAVVHLQQSWRAGSRPRRSASRSPRDSPPPLALSLREGLAGNAARVDAPVATHAQVSSAKFARRTVAADAARSRLGACMPRLRARGANRGRGLTSCRSTTPHADSLLPLQQQPCAIYSARRHWHQLPTSASAAIIALWDTSLPDSVSFGMSACRTANLRHLAAPSPECGVVGVAGPLPAECCLQHRRVWTSASSGSRSRIIGDAFQVPVADRSTQLVRRKSARALVHTQAGSLRTRKGMQLAAAVALLAANTPCVRGRLSGAGRTLI